MSSRKRGLIFINLMIAGIVSSLLSTAMTTALPAISKSFGVDIATGQWMTSGYSLVMGIVMPLSAFLVKKIPTKRLYLIGIVSFIVGEVLSIIPGSFAVMMIGRILQACGNGLVFAMTQVIILTIYPKEQKGTMMGWYGMAASAAPIIAPTLAGIIVDSIGWQYIFIFTMAIMIGALVMAFFVMTDILELQPVTFDTMSFVLSIAAFGGITLGIGNITKAGLFSLAAGLPLVIGLAGGVLFVLRQLHQEQPFLDVAILRKKEYALSVIASMLLYLALMGGTILFPLLIQQIQGKSATVSGLVTLPGSLITAIVSPFAGKLYDRFGIKKIFLVESILLLISNACMCMIQADSALWVLILLNALRCLGIGGLMMPLLTWGTSFVTKSKVSDASALLTSLRTVAGSIGAALCAGLLSSGATPIAGLHSAFLFVTVCCILMLLIAVYVSILKKPAAESQKSGK